MSIFGTTTTSSLISVAEAASKVMKLDEHCGECEMGINEEFSEKDFDALKKGDTITIDFKSSMSSGKATFKVTAKNIVGKAKVHKATLKNVKRPTGVKFYLYKRGNKVSLAQGDMAASVVKYTVEEVKIDESTAEYSKSLEKIANDRALKMLTKSERENLKKIAALLDKERKEEYVPEETLKEADYELYHKDFSSAMQHAYTHAKKKGFTVDPNEIDDKVATGPKKPSKGKTNRYILGTNKKQNVHIQVANLDNKRFELNMYIEGVQIKEALNPLGGKPFEDLKNVADVALKVMRGESQEVKEEEKETVESEEKPQELTEEIV